MYSYWAYGLTVKSNIEFPELYPIDYPDQYEVVLTLGDLSLLRDYNLDHKSSGWFICDDYYFLKIDGVGSFLAEFGKNIIIVPEKYVDLDHVRLYCLSNLFAAILYQKRKIPIHCSGALKNGHLVLIMGESLSGKSTTLGGLLENGFNVFSDDVCIPYYDNETQNICFYSSYPMMKYWKSTIQHLGIDFNTISKSLWPNIEKYGLYFHHKFILEPRFPLMAVVLKVDNYSKSATIKKIEGIKAFDTIQQHAYRKEYLKFMDLKHDFFSLFVKLTNQIDIFEITRPSSLNSIDDVVRLIQFQFDKYLAEK